MKTELTIEESAKLIELGVDSKLASGIYSVWIEYNPYLRGVYQEVKKPIFTLTDILAILPKEIIINKSIYEINIDATKAYYSAVYILWDENENGETIMKDVKPDTSLSTELIDALYQLLCWVIDNHYFNLK